MADPFILTTIDSIFLVFTAGFLLQVIIRGWEKFLKDNWAKGAVLVFIISLILTLSIKTIDFLVLGGIILFVSFRDELLDCLTEAKLIQQSVIFYYMVFFLTPLPQYILQFLEMRWSEFSTGNMFLLIPFLILIIILFATLILTLKVLIIAFSTKENDRKTEVLAYIWFMIMNIIFSAWYITQIAPGLFGQGDVSLIDTFMAGTMSVLIFANILQLITTFARGKHQSTLSYQQQIKKNFDLFEKKFIDINISREFAVLIILLQGGILLLNHLLQIVPISLIVSISLLSATFLHTIYFHKASK